MQSHCLPVAGRSVSTRLILTLLSPVLILGCSSTPEVVRENQPPTVELTSGPVEGETVSYSITIGWEGTDPDGMVARYEYAMDPPAVFTEEEIASGGPEVVSEIIPGTGSDPDVTRITKVVGGETVSFNWVHTVDTSHDFIFQTAEAESLDAGGGPAPTGRFTGMHAVYVRAVDDDEAVSVPDHVAFTAETVAPEATITRPDIASDILTTGPRVLVEWTGTDPDGPAPVGYLYKLLRLDTLQPPWPVITVTSPHALFEKGGDWIYGSAEAPGIELDLATPGQYLFGLRALDEAGAEEPFLDFGRNAFKFQAFAGGARPTVILSCVTGSHAFRGTDIPVQVQVPANLDLTCEVTCYADQYGESCADMRWGVDIAELETDEGWSPWSTDFTLGPVTFPKAGIHVLYVQVRDTLGNSTQATLILTVVEFPFDREVLWVDDSFDNIYPNDAENDAFWRARLDAYPGFGAGDVSEYHVFGDNDRATLNPQTPDLSVLGRYKLLVWDVKGSGFDGVTALVKAMVNRSLPLYLAAGGKLWLEGTLNIAATLPVPAVVRGDLVYPKELEPGDFPWEFLKLHTSGVYDDKGFNQRNNLLVVHPFPGRSVVYNEMRVDSLKQNVALAGLGIAFCDAVFDPILVGAEPGFRGTLDSLYTYGATGPEAQGKGSSYQDRLVAVRWHDPDPGREQGRIQWFGFPLYYFQDAEAQETLNRSLDWFREESPPAVP